jgi:hypothetical protein
MIENGITVPKAYVEGTIWNVTREMDIGLKIITGCCINKIGRLNVEYHLIWEYKMELKQKQYLRRD